MSRPLSQEKIMDNVLSQGNGSLEKCWLFKSIILYLDCFYPIVDTTIWLSKILDQIGWSEGRFWLLSKPQPNLSCYWPDFDETLKVGSCEHLEQIPTVRVTFVHATFVLTTFVDIRNISAVSDLILMKLYR